MDGCKGHFDMLLLKKYEPYKLQIQLFMIDLALSSVHLKLENVQEKWLKFFLSANRVSYVKAKNPVLAFTEVHQLVIYQFFS